MGSDIRVLGSHDVRRASERDLERQLRERVAVAVHMSQELYRVKVRDEDFQTIKAQLRALGLIEKSLKKRSLKDTQSYWTLTPYGEHYATVLKAILDRRDCGGR